MKLRIKAALFFVLLLTVCAWPGAAQQAAAQAPASQTQANNVQLVIEGKVINVHDGDTITVLDKDNKKFHIRLQGIDAPELKQEYGSVSQQNLSRLVMGKQVTIVWNKVDKYRRTVGTIMLDGKDVNIEQVKAGLAWHFKKYQDEQEPKDRVTYAKAEEDARAAKLGLWQDPNPTPPGEWRADVKTARWGPAPPDGTIIGNKQSKKYHRPDCPGYRDMAEKNRVFFKSVEEAEAAGYKRAGNCPAEIITTNVASTPKTTATPAQASTTQSSTAKAVPVAASASTPAATAADGEIIGNKNSKVYHKPGCAGYTRVSEKNQVRFKTAEEAEAAGYKLAGNCKSDGAAPATVSTPSAIATTSQTLPAKETPSNASTSAPSTPAASTGGAAAATTGDIIGNKNSKIYHRPDCPGYNGVSEKNQVHFKSVAEAEAAGYRAAKNCPAQ
ncbi:MAG TPA: thermonuclease family protein [Pyrinomonadaceae bacterium]|nr:thermonuclease family protein [Pyrinomonadaceae bacterium]